LQIGTRTPAASLVHVGRLMGLSLERVRQIEKDALVKLRLCVLEVSALFSDIVEFARHDDRPHPGRGPRPYRWLDRGYARGRRARREVVNI